MKALPGPTRVTEGPDTQTGVRRGGGTWLCPGAAAADRLFLCCRCRAGSLPRVPRSASPRERQVPEQPFRCALHTALTPDPPKMSKALNIDFYLQAKVLSSGKRW